MSGHEVDGMSAGRPAPWSRFAGRSAVGLQVAFVVAAGGMVCVFQWLPHARQQQVGEVSRIFLGILFEALPFMLIGALAGGVIEVFIPREAVTGVLSGRRRRTVLVAAGLGLIFPVCECAIVPVVRRLVRKGAPLSAAVAFLLAGPIVNPIVLASTAVAYAGDWHVVAVRAILGYVIAVIVGLTMGKVFDAEAALVPQAAGGGHDHDHGHDHGDGSACCAGPSRPGLAGRLTAAVGHAAWDFLDVGRFLVIGALLAAVLRTLIRREDLMLDAGDGPVSMLVMMALAFSLNLCSEADAFVAASFRGLVGPLGQMAFMVLGPMLDTKLLVMYLGLFRKRAILALTVSVVAAVFLAIVLYGHVLELGRLCVLLARQSLAS